MSASEIGLALLVALGLVGILVPLLPGSALVVLATAIWTITGAGGGTSGTRWAVLVAVTAIVLAGAAAKYLVPGRRLQRAGIGSRTLLAGAVLGVVGFFVVPVVGLPLGFVAGVYLAEWQRLGAQAAWPATRAALTAVGLGVLIELAFGVAAAATWMVGALAT